MGVLFVPLNSLPLHSIFIILFCEYTGAFVGTGNLFPAG